MPHSSERIIRSVAAVATALGLACAASAAPPPSPFTFLQSHGNECAGVPQCVSVASESSLLAVDQIKSLAVGCPEQHPYGWHWDTAQHSQIHVRLVARTRNALTFSMANQGNSAGRVGIVVGCSTEPFDIRITGTQTSRRGAYTHPGNAQGGAR